MRLTREPRSFSPYAIQKNEFDGTIEVDLGDWEPHPGGKVERYHLRIDVLKIPKLIEAIGKSSGEKRLYRCLHVFRAV